MRHGLTAWMLLISLLLLTHCALPTEEQGDNQDGARRGPELPEVGLDLALKPLTTNALTTNALTTNALATNALATNALTTDALTALKDPGPEGDLFRLLLKYTVSCALKPPQTFDFSWTDSANTQHQESYLGELGIAPTWAAGPLDANGQEMVSACLAARTNWYGLRVVISMRYVVGGLLHVVGVDVAGLLGHPIEDILELLSYTYTEGAFWGNLFAPSPHLHACYDPQNTTHARSALRDCANGHLDESGKPQDCGMIDVVGPCSDVCAAPIVPVLLGLLGQYYPSCQAPGLPATSHVITTALP
jgi:hypothetical protein